MILNAFFINLIASIISYFIIKYLIIKNYNLPNVFEYFTMYTLTGMLLILFYIKNISNNIMADIFIFIIFIFYYIRSYDASRKKFHERFRSMILSFGYTRNSYFETFLSKKLILKGTESFFYGTGVFYILNKLINISNDNVNIINILIPSILLFIASIVKTTKTGKIYKFVK
ncbi:hypothetical protein OF820_00975 [Oceanotoga sp. DSM 15011]|jgi:hypothetical protein|uniref:Uncharacterized protein n=1 Tax=Oceanotoga teriensis TaxID=515440 RepID=A0AA45HJU3_9BACT|nr:MULTISPECIES: hypothetical protein [Oceanotoga]MDN5341624.1 hypothetical protein [Oceanotoga sp.]MDO7977173.1 hypothetical protein [Oceanotoga teriensis]PWJ96556.1 hypothetical protein C7380_101129 [Oceanotoga teriensis]UYP00270.1 hypothetical protein OF820_00975 [Oceanotoga sp. DSM 15011]